MITPFGGTLVDLSPVEGRVEFSRFTAPLKFAWAPLPRPFALPKRLLRPAAGWLSVVPSYQRTRAAARLAIPGMKVS